MDKIEKKKFNRLAVLTLLLSALYVLCITALSTKSIQDYFDRLSYNPLSFNYGSGFFVFHLGLILPNILFYCSAVFVIVAVVTGVISLRQIKKTNEKGRMISLIMTTINIFLVGYFLLVFLIS